MWCIISRESNGGGGRVTTILQLPFCPSFHSRCKDIIVIAYPDVVVVVVVVVDNSYYTLPIIYCI
jgi:hypothetical protein